MAWNPFRSKCKYAPTRIHDNDITKNLLPGDIIFHRAMREDGIGVLTRLFTHSPYRHVEIYVRDGWAISAEWMGATYADKLNEKFVDVFRLKDGLTPQQLEKILSFLENNLGERYSIMQMFGFPFIFPRLAIWLTKHNAHNCSELTSLAYHSAGIDLVYNWEESVEAPADIARSKKVEFIGSWCNALPVDDAQPNYIHPCQGVPKLFPRILMKIVAFISPKDEIYKKIAEQDIYHD